MQKKSVVSSVIVLVTLLAMLACNLGSPVASPGPTDGAPAVVGDGPPEATAGAEPTEGSATTPETGPLPTLVPTTASLPQAPSDAPGAPGALNVPLQVHNPTDQPRRGEPVTSGVPLPLRLMLADASRLRLVDSQGNPVPAQFTPLARWGAAPDDNIAPLRWVLVDFQASVGPQDTAYFYLQEGGPGPAPAQALVVEDGADALVITTGSATGAGRFSISKTDGGLTAPHLSNPIFGRALGADGEHYTTAGPVSVQVTLAGPLRVSVQVTGDYRSVGGEILLAYTSRYWFYAGGSGVRLFHTLENNNLCPVDEGGQIDCYDIGSEGSVRFSDVSLVAPTDLSLGGALDYYIAGETVISNGGLTGDLVLYQDSSGTGSWDTYPTLTDWDGNPLDTRPRLQSYVRFQGYETTLGGSLIDAGNHALGWMQLEGKAGTWAVTVIDFWQNFPKALRAAPDGRIEIGLFPGEFGVEDFAFTLRAGEHKTHEVWLNPADPGASPVLATGAAPLFAAAPPLWYVDSGAFGLTATPDRGDWTEHEDYILYQLEPAPIYDEWMNWYGSLPAAIEATDFYGIFDYGDWPIDYEGYGVSPLNAKYDNNYGLWLQWARGGDPRWFGLAGAANRHLADVDILHNLHSPRHWADGIAFGHSYHDEEGFWNPHRNYGGNHPDTAFGTRGMLLTYYLTGYEKAYEASLELADSIEYRMHNDWHLCAYFPDCNGDGFGLNDGPGLYADGCRPAANGVSIAVAAYQATADPRYLAVADALVAWARAEGQPYLGGPTGAEDMMKPQMLNMYLRALAEYLEMRTEFGLPDTYDAAGSYLAYADYIRSYAWVDLEPLDGNPRAAFPYEWWFDGRQGDPNDEWSVGNNVAFPTNWLLLGADALAYAYSLSGDVDYLDRAAILFYTGSHDPFYEGDDNTYTGTKETANGIVYGNIFLYNWWRSGR